MTAGKVVCGVSSPGERQEHSRFEVDDGFAQAVVDVARELDAQRTAWERFRDAGRSLRLLLDLLRHWRRRGR